jgi:hypothetical protein
MWDEVLQNIEFSFSFNSDEVEIKIDDYDFSKFYRLKDGWLTNTPFGNSIAIPFSFNGDYVNVILHDDIISLVTNYKPMLKDYDKCVIRLIKRDLTEDEIVEKLDKLLSKETHNQFELDQISFFYKLQMEKMNKVSKGLSELSNSDKKELTKLTLNELTKRGKPRWRKLKRVKM